jgi:glycosyltransferase involved in cell wall biosynthesis
MISVIIPTYKEPDVLDLCLKSAINGQLNTNQIIVVVDGYYDINKYVLDKYKSNIDILKLDTNVGLSRATNLGVYNASNNVVFVVNDDNVFPKKWDVNLMNHYSPNTVLTPNQIEPTPSMFKQFVIHNLGTNLYNFDLDLFWEYELSISVNHKENTGSTLPFLISKVDYLRVGGWDETYPSHWVVDWDFFLKCELSGMNMVRTYNSHFYHFVSVGTELTEDDRRIKYHKEVECHNYFKYKWGVYANNNPDTNSKIIKIP